MGELEDKLASMLNNPQLMQQIMSMAQTMNEGHPQKESALSEPIPDIDLKMLQRFSGLAQKSAIDTDQRMLLSALSPYLSKERISKLEKAMRAARMAKLASGFLNTSQISSGR